MQAAEGLIELSLVEYSVSAWLNYRSFVCAGLCRSATGLDGRGADKIKSKKKPVCFTLGR